MFKKIIQAAHDLLEKSREVTPEVIKIVNEVRLLAHLSGALSPEAEKKFQAMTSRFSGLIVSAGKLVALPPLNAQGLRTDGPTFAEWQASGSPGGAYPPEGYAPVEDKVENTPDQMEYEAGFNIGKARGVLPDGASDSAKAGFIAGMSAGEGQAGSSPIINPPAPEAPVATGAPNPPVTDAIVQNGDDLNAPKTN